MEPSHSTISEKWLDALQKGMETIIDQATAVSSRQTVQDFDARYYGSQLFLLKKIHRIFLALRSHPESEGRKSSILKLEQDVQRCVAALRY